MLIFKSYGLQVPPNFNRYVRATLLSTWTWMIKCHKLFLKVRIAGFNASYSRTLYWNASPPLIISPLSKLSCSMSDPFFVEASVWMIIWNSCCWIFFLLQSFKFSVHQRSCSLVKFPSVTWPLQDHLYVELILICRKSLICRTNIWSCWIFRNRIRAGIMTWTVDDSRSIESVRFKTRVFGCVNTFWHLWDRNFICFAGWRADFWGWS